MAPDIRVLPESFSMIGRDDREGILIEAALCEGIE
jgi:hypothetical protein